MCLLEVELEMVYPTTNKAVCQCGDYWDPQLEILEILKLENHIIKHIMWSWFDPNTVVQLN